MFKPIRWIQILPCSAQLSAGLSWCSLVILIGLLSAGQMGCAAHKQIQYFAATDPETGQTSYYKMTVSGSGGFPMDYHLQAGYFSAAAVDILRGSMPKIPTLDMDIEHEEQFRALTDRYYESLIDEADAVAPPGPRRGHALARENLERCEKQLQAAQSKKRQLEIQIATADAEANEAGISRAAALRNELASNALEITRRERDVVEAQECTDALWSRFKEELGNPNAVTGKGRSPQEIEDRIKQLSRLVWFGSLSDTDVMSVGMTGDTDPYRFRKLVFWASASNIDLNSFAGEIDGVINNTVTLAETFRAQSQARKAAQQARGQGLKGIVDRLITDPATATSVHGIIDLLMPAEAAASADPVGGSP